MTTEHQKVLHFSLRDILTIIFKRKWIILFVFLATVSLVTIGTFLITPTYEAESTLMVKMGREHVYQPEVGSANPSISFDQERVIESEIQILKSRDLLTKVINTIGIEKMYPSFARLDSQSPPLEASISHMQEHLLIADVKKSNVIKVNFQHESPTMAAKAVNLLIEFLLERHLQIFSNPRAEFLGKQVSTHQSNLDVARNSLQDFKQQHGLSSLQEEQRLLLEQRRDLDTALKTVQNDREGLKSKLSSLLGQISHIPKFVSLTSVSERQKVIDEAKSNLLKLRLQEQELSTRYKKTSRRVANILNEISMTQSFIQEQEAQLMDRVTKGKNPVYQELEIEIHKSKSEYRSLETQSKQLALQLEDVDANLVKLDALKKELETLTRAVESNQNNYATYLAKVEEARVSEEMDELKMANISIIQSASVPVKPIKPKKFLNIFLGIMFGALLGISFAFTSEYFQSGYTRPEQASQDLGLPILVSIKHRENLI